MAWQLLEENGENKGRVIPVTRASFWIGRDRACQFRPDSLVVSRIHCCLKVYGRRLFVMACRTTNGTLVNGRALEGEQELQAGDHLNVGPLGFVIGTKPAGAPDEGASAQMLLHAN